MHCFAWLADVIAQCTSFLSVECLQRNMAQNLIIYLFLNEGETDMHIISFSNILPIKSKSVSEDPSSFSTELKLILKTKNAGCVCT